MTPDHRRAIAAAFERLGAALGEVALALLGPLTGPDPAPARCPASPPREASSSTTAAPNPAPPSHPAPAELADASGRIPAAARRAITLEALAALGGSARSSEVARAMGVSDVTARKHLRALAVAGKVIRSGSAAQMEYRLPAPGEPAGDEFEAEHPARSALLRELYRVGSASPRDLARACKITHGMATYHLARLLDRGEVRATGSRRTRRYWPTGEAGGEKAPASAGPEEVLLPPHPPAPPPPPAAPRRASPDPAGPPPLPRPPEIPADRPDPWGGLRPKGAAKALDWQTKDLPGDSARALQVLAYLHGWRVTLAAFARIYWPRPGKPDVLGAKGLLERQEALGLVRLEWSSSGIFASLTTHGVRLAAALPDLDQGGSP